MSIPRSFRSKQTAGVCNHLGSESLEGHVTGTIGRPQDNNTCMQYLARTAAGRYDRDV